MKTSKQHGSVLSGRTVRKYDSEGPVRRGQRLEDETLCEDIIFTKVSIDQPEGKTYSLQLVFNSEEQQNHFLDEWLPDIEKKIIQIFSNRYLCFSSILTEI